MIICLGFIIESAIIGFIIYLHMPNRRRYHILFIQGIIVSGSTMTGYFGEFDDFSMNQALYVRYFDHRYTLLLLVQYTIQSYYWRNEETISVSGLLKKSLIRSIIHY